MATGEDRTTKGVKAVSVATTNKFAALQNAPEEEGWTLVTGKRKRGLQSVDRRDNRYLLDHKKLEPASILGPGVVFQ